MATLCHVAENSRGDRLLRERRACAQRYAHGCRGLALYLHRQHRHMDMGDMAHMAIMAITDPPVLKATDCACSRPAVSELLVNSSGGGAPAVAETLPRVRRRLPQSPIVCVTSRWALKLWRRADRVSAMSCRRWQRDLDQTASGGLGNPLAPRKSGQRLP